MRGLLFPCLKSFLADLNFIYCFYAEMDFCAVFNFCAVLRLPSEEMSLFKSLNQFGDFEQTNLKMFMMLLLVDPQVLASVKNKSSISFK